MSRLIVKNLPKNTSEQKIREVFGKKGTITDIQLKFKDGKFRQFGFVGFENEQNAQDAVKFLNNTFVGTSKITVEVCASLGDESKPKSWSRYAKDSETYKKKHEKKVDLEEADEEQEPVKEDKKISKKTAKIEAIIGDRKDDPMFQEFVQSHAKDKLAWKNDIGVKGEKDDEEKAASDIKDDLDEKAANKEISDADYMKQLMGEAGTKSKNEKSSKDKKPKESLVKLFTIKIRNIPKKVKREELIKFFRPAKAHSVRIPKTAGYAYVGFKLERDLQRALTKDKSFLKGKQIHVYDFTEKNFFSEEDRDAKKRQNPRWQEQQDTLKNEEEICDSGKLFFRNLAYTVTEDELQKLFETYGTVVEVSLPIDSITRKIKGFGTVTFMMPENAVTAYSELNGSMFHGRMFHLLPGKSDDKKSDDEKDEDGKDFKSNKLKELKKSAGSSLNWNTLFMGTNAVAEVMARTYGRSKEEVLDASTGGSNAAVRLALGETQIVLEMKKFLENQGVQLDAFDDTNPKRSKTVILAKNLPAGTGVDELREKFASFGLIDKIILPPSGVTCLIKFDNSNEARKAFKKLAYSKFKHLPLYLEWAPEKVFRDSDKVKEERTVEKKEEDEEEAEKVTNAVELKESDDEEDDTPPEADTTLFLKGLNFQTVESTVQEKFKHLGPIQLVQIARKRNPENPQQQLALGYGFIQFKLTKSADKALKTMQFCMIDEKQIELKRSDRTLQGQVENQRKPSAKKSGQATSTKIMVRNIPFQANANEIRDLFKTFGELKAVRLPKKMTPGVDQHRGFGFIEFLSKSDAKNAFEALHHSTHLYGRRLVLEWAAVDQDVDEIRKRTADQVGRSGGEGSKPKRSKKALLKDEDFIKLAASDDEDD